MSGLSEFASPEREEKDMAMTRSEREGETEGDDKSLAIRNGRTDRGKQRYSEGPIAITPNRQQRSSFHRHTR